MKYVLLLIVLFSQHAYAFSHGANLPCNLVVCAEAYSVTRQMVGGYNGPLFQLYNGSTTLDIGQKGGSVDLSTWSAFCSGVQANCKIGKIYAQINTSGSNDMIPSQFIKTGPACATGTFYKCAAPFSIEVATGLPIIDTVVGGYEYTLVGDNPAVGINGGKGSLSIIYNGHAVQQIFCCGSFGLSHKYDAGDTIGTDFLIMFQYSNTGMFQPCASSTTFCMGVEEETLGDVGDYGSSIINIIGSVTFNSPTNTITGILNGHSIFTNKPPGTNINTGISIHLSGGGDLGQPAPVLMREALITNSPLSTTEQTSVLNNMKAFYNGLSFP